MVVTDTSFLFSLFGSDAHTAAAHAWALQTKQPIAITALNRYEFGNALRFAVFRKAISRHDAANSLAAFAADLKNGILQPSALDLADVFEEATSLSELHTATGGHRSFDILHVATARVLGAKLFLSFDANQRKLALAAKLAAGP